MYGAAHAAGPVQPCPPHWPQCVCVAPTAVDVLVAFVLEIVTIVLVERVDLMEEVDDTREVVELETGFPGLLDVVDPISPQRMFENTT